MALPKWITPAGNLGVVPELDFYDLVFDVNDPSGGNLVYTHISGRLPLGIQVIESGRLQGVPVSEAGGDQNVEYTFSVRVKNEIDFVGSISGTVLTVTSVGTGALDIGQTLERTGILPRTTIVGKISGTGNIGTYKINQSQSLNLGNFIATSGISDRTFRLTVTNIAPPIISVPTRNSFLGLYLDGEEINLQLEAIEFTPSIDLKWELYNGDLPQGLSINEDGLLSGYIYPIASSDPNADPGWDDSPWSFAGWDFNIIAVSKIFRFTVQVSDGLKYDQSTYTLLVFPRSSLKADSDIITVDLVNLGTQGRLTIDAGEKHRPIITTVQEDFIPARQGTFYTFDLDVIDLDSDIVWWAFSEGSTGAFDEQNILGTGLPYVGRRLIGGRLAAGLFPRSNIFTVGDLQVVDLDYTNVNYQPGDLVKVLNSNNTYEVGIITDRATVQIKGNSVPALIAGDTITQSSSGASATVTSASSSKGNIRLGGNIIYGNISTAIQSYQIVASGNISANVGNFITQTGIVGNAIVTSRPGYLTLELTANLQVIQAGDTIRQSTTGSNAKVLMTPDFLGSSNTFFVEYTNANNFNLGSGNVSVIRGTTTTSINTYPTFSNVVLNTVNILYYSGQFVTSSLNLRVNGVNSGAFPTSIIRNPVNKTFTANAGTVITQFGTTGTAKILRNVVDSVVLPVIITDPTFTPYAGNLYISGADANVWIEQFSTTILPYEITATVGDTIIQPSTGATAIVTANVVQKSVVEVDFTANNFIIGSGNLQLNSSNITAFPGSVTCLTQVGIDYNTPATFDINFFGDAGQIFINGIPAYSTVSNMIDAEVTLTGTINEGDIGFDESRFDQSQLVVPAGLSLNPRTGILSGRLPALTVNKVDYQFEIAAFKRDEPNYLDTALFTLTVLGDINNTIEWITDSDLGSIQNGKISDLYLEAKHISNAIPKQLIYVLKPGARKKLPQGLELLPTGLIVGRVSFQIFSLDRGDTTIDRSRTTFDETFVFDVETRDLDTTISAERTFTIRVLGVNKKPYENLYLRALPTLEERNQFTRLLQNGAIFPMNLLYRNEDPWFGVAKEIRFLFLPGLDPSTAADYTTAAETNHFRKRLKFGQVKTARALDRNFDVKYEVVYLEIQDDNTNSLGQGPANIIDLTGKITPYYDFDGQEFSIVYPNAFSNMQSKMVSEIGYANKGALPDWMTSRQINGRVLGFTRALVLAYCKPGGSAVIAYRLQEYGVSFNEYDFTVDRYLLDNIYSENYDITEQSFLTSFETTFDKYPRLPSFYFDAGVVDYAVSDAFEIINNKPLSYIQASRSLGGLGGLDGITNIKDGHLLVFAKQEFELIEDQLGYNVGWSQVKASWDDDSGTPGNIGPVTTDDIEWDQSLWDETGYVPGFQENNLDPGIANQRISVWRVNITSTQLVRLTFVKEIKYFDKLFVRNGVSYGGTNIFFDPTIKEGKTVPDYSLIVQEIKTKYTTFDGNGTRFYDNRDEYIDPGEGDKYIKFTKTGVFT